MLQISLPVILLDEAFKYLSRNHVDGEWEAPSHPLCCPPASGLPPHPPCSWAAADAVGAVRRASVSARGGGVLGSPSGGHEGTLVTGTQGVCRVLHCRGPGPAMEAPLGPHCLTVFTCHSLHGQGTVCSSGPRPLTPLHPACLYPGVLRTVSQAWSRQPMTASWTPDHTGLASLVSPCGWVKGRVVSELTALGLP